MIDGHTRSGDKVKGKNILISKDSKERLSLYDSRARGGGEEMGREGWERERTVLFLRAQQ